MRIDHRTLAKITFPPLLAPLVYYAYPRSWVLFVLAVIVLTVVFKKERLPAKDLGLRTDNLKKCLIVYLFLFLITPACCFCVSKIGVDFGKQPIPLNLVWLVFLSAAVQELYFRGYFIAHARRVVSDYWAVVLYTSLVFALFHSVFLPLEFFNLNLVFFSFVLSILWTGVYLKYSNLYLMVLLHFINNLCFYFIILH